jgi:hypothetical protein
MSTTKPRRGRPPKKADSLKDQSVLLRLETSEKMGFTEAAKIAGLPLSAWMRERLRWAASGDLEKMGREVPFFRK